MGRFLHLYRVDSFINESTIFSVDISEFENSFSLIFDRIESQMEKIEAIIIDENCFEKKYELFEFITYFRLNRPEKWDIPIFIFKNILSNKDTIEFLKNDYNNIIKTKRIDFISSKDLEKDNLSGKIRLETNLNVKLSEYLNFEEFIRTIKVEGSNLNNHSIANEWGIFQLAKYGNIKISEIEGFNEEKLNSIYFKYLIALNNLNDSQKNEIIAEQKQYVKKLEGLKVLGKIDLAKFKK